MIDIVRDYTAISRGSAQAVRARVADVVLAGTRRIIGWGQPSGAGLPHHDEPSVLAGLAAVPRALAATVQAECDRTVERLGLVRAAELGALRSQVEWIERRVGELRGDR